MRRMASAALMVVTASAVMAAAPALFQSPTESKWSVAGGSKTLGTLTVLTSGSASRAEWKPSAGGAVSIFLGGNGKVWLRSTGGDLDLSSISPKSTESLVAPPLLLPFTVSGSDKIEVKEGRPASYSFRGAKASYQYDAKGPSSIEVTDGGTRYTLKRLSLSPSTADASNFAIRPKTAAASRLAQLSGNLLGSSDTSVSATAGGRGVGTKGLKLKDGGDYEAVHKLELRDDGWRPKLDSALQEFQKDGKVGKDRGDQ
jgi:hypothetical protein